MEQNEYVNFSLEASKLEAIASTYPAMIREDLLWLGSFIRERCAKNLDVLVTKTKKLGYTTDKTTFSKILRGRWDKDADGNPLKFPVMSAKNFQQIVDGLRAESRLESMAGKVPFVETSTWRDIKNYIDIKRSPEQVCKFGLIAGPTGSQKTACLKHYSLLNNHGRVVHLESPERPTVAKFIAELAQAYGVPQKVSGDKKHARIRENINDRKTIMIDNIQRLHKEREGWNQPIFSYLQKLQDDTGCTVILCCVPEFERQLTAGMDAGYFEQFEGRVGGRSEFLILPEYAPREDVLEIAESFGLPDAEKYVSELEEISRQRGRIRILFNALQKAKRLAGNRAMTIKHVRMAMDREES